MDQQDNLGNPQDVAAKLASGIRALPNRNTPNIRALRRQFTNQLMHASPHFIHEVARTLLMQHGHRWVAYELIADHRAAFQCLGEVQLGELGQGIDSWSSVDAFARTLAGPAWLQGQIKDDVIHRWARSEDLWWRRAALVSTVALNVRSHGGMGDVDRTLAVCRMLVSDPEDMVVKGLSWALRELVVHNAQAVTEFLDEHEHELAARVKREVRDKLTTGLKNPAGRKARA